MAINDWEDVPLDKVTDWEDVTDAPVAETPEVSKLESLGRGGAQGLSFGFADELTGALESMIGDKTYEQARDESRNEYTKAEEANPKTFMAGNVAGAVAPAIAATIATGGTAAPAIIPTLGRSIAIGAGQGAIDALGRSEADLTKGEFTDAAKDTARGAAIGTVAGGVAHGASKAVENLLPALKKLATEGGDSALGLNVQSIKKMGEDKAEDVIEHALKPSPYLEKGESIIGGMKDNTKAMWDKATKVRDAAGEDIGSILEQMDEVSPKYQLPGIKGPSTVGKQTLEVGPNKELNWVTKDIPGEPLAVSSNIPDTVVTSVKAAVNRAKNEIETLAPNLGETVAGQYRKAIYDFDQLVSNPEVPLTFKKLGEFKKIIGDIAYKHGNPLESKAALQEVYALINDGLEKSVDAVSAATKNAELPAAYKAAKKAYDMSLRAIDGLEGKSAKELGGKWVGFGDVMVGGMGSAIGGVPGMIAAVAGKRAIEARGAQAIGKTSFTMAEKLERALTANPQLLGKYLPMLQQASQRGQLAATNYVLQQRDPEYAETLKKLDEQSSGE